MGTAIGFHLCNLLRRVTEYKCYSTNVAEYKPQSVGPCVSSQIELHNSRRFLGELLDYNTGEVITAEG